jgi:hypothetical protein
MNKEGTCINLRGREQHLKLSEKKDFQSLPNSLLYLWTYVYYNDGSVRLYERSNQYVTSLSLSFRETKEHHHKKHNYEESEYNEGVYYSNGSDSVLYNSNNKPIQVQFVFGPNVNVQTIRLRLANAKGVSNGYPQDSRPYQSIGVKFIPIKSPENGCDPVGWSYTIDTDCICDTFCFSISGVHKNCSGYNFFGPHNIQSVIQDSSMEVKYCHRYNCETELINNFVNPTAIPYRDISAHDYGETLKW